MLVIEFLLEVNCTTATNASSSSLSFMPVKICCHAFRLAASWLDLDSALCSSQMIKMRPQVIPLTAMCRKRKRQQDNLLPLRPPAGPKAHGLGTVHYASQPPSPCRDSIQQPPDRLPTSSHLRRRPFHAPGSHTAAQVSARPYPPGWSSPIPRNNARKKQPWPEAQQGRVPESGNDSSGVVSERDTAPCKNGTAGPPCTPFQQPALVPRHKNVTPDGPHAHRSSLQPATMLQAKPAGCSALEQDSTLQPARLNPAGSRLASQPLLIKEAVTDAAPATRAMNAL